MSLPTYYSVGSASIASGGHNVVTFSGALLGTADNPTIQAGDLFCDPAQPTIPPQRIASVDYDAGTAALAVNWPGTTMAAAPYEVRYVGDTVRSTAQTREVLTELSTVQANGRGLFYTFDDTTTDADPGAGKFRLNNATIASATAAYADNLDADGATVSAVLDSWDDGGSSSGRGQLWVRSIANPSTFAAFNVTGSVTDGTGYRKLVLAYVGGSGSLAADDEIMVMFSPIGAAGTDGAGLFSRVRAVSTSNITISTALNSGDTIDGVTLSTNDLVLVAGQTTASENGIYVVGTSPARDTAFDTFDEHPGAYVSVMEGAAYADTLWRCTSDKGGTLGTTDLVFSLYSSGLPTVATRTALKALATANFTTAILTEAGRIGIFVFRSGDYSALVTADSQEGVYVKADDTASTSGAWIRSYSGDVNVKWFGAKGDGTTDDTTAVQVAVTVANSLDVTVYLPTGTYLSSQLTLSEFSRLRGDGATRSILKKKSGTTTDLVVTSTTDDADICIEDMSFDGNYPTVTAGNTVYIRGSRPTIRNVTIINSAGIGLKTDYVSSDRTYSVLGHFEHITIDKAKTTGWYNAGPNDSYIEHVEIVDASLGTDVTGYGYYATGAGTARIFDMHVWNRSPTGNKPIAGAYLNNGGNIVTGSHFESGSYSMIINADDNLFSECAWYAPDGTVALLLIGSYNRVRGMVGGGADGLFPDYIGVYIGLDGSHKSGGNIIDVVDAGCNNGAVDFTYSNGGNNVRVRGTKASGKLSYSGSPQASDVVDITTDGVGGATLFQGPYAAGSGLSLSGNIFALAEPDMRPAFRNKLINPYGQFNQRLPPTNADNTYGHDRWVALTQTSTIAVSSVSNAADGTPFMWRLTQSQASAQRMGYAQWIEGANARPMRGKTVTLSGKIKFSLNAAVRYAICEWTGTQDTLSTARDPVNDWTSGTYTGGNFFKNTTFNVLAVGSITPAANTLTDITALSATVGSSANNLMVFLWTEGTAAQNATLDGALQLEVGAAASPFEFRPASVELSMCHRYFHKTFPIGTAPGDSVTNSGSISIVVQAVTGIYAQNWIYPAQMRTIPTITTYAPGTGGTAAYWRNAGNTSSSQPLVTSIGERSAQIYLNNAGSASWTSEGWLIQATADAEL